MMNRPAKSLARLSEVCRLAPRFAAWAGGARSDWFRGIHNPLSSAPGGPGPWMLVMALFGWMAGMGCRPVEPVSSRPLIVVSVPPQAYFVEQLAGDLVTVAVMIPPGASPALYEPTFDQMKALSHATLYIKVGHPNFAFERAWLDRIVGQNPRLKVVDASAHLVAREGDPHVWVSPQCVRCMATNIHESLAAILPDHHPALVARLRRFLADIDDLDADLHQILDARPGGKFLVFHPAWGHFARDYGLEQIAIEQGSKEPSPDQLAKLIDRARREDVGVVFVQPQFSRASAELVAAEMGGRVVAIDPLERQWPENLRRVAHAFRESLKP